MSSRYLNYLLRMKPVASDLTTDDGDSVLVITDGKLYRVPKNSLDVRHGGATQTTITPTSPPSRFKNFFKKLPILTRPLTANDDANMLLVSSTGTLKQAPMAKLQTRFNSSFVPTPTPTPSPTPTPTPTPTPAPSPVSIPTAQSVNIFVNPSTSGWTIANNGSTGSFTTNGSENVMQVAYTGNYQKSTFTPPAPITLGSTIVGGDEFTFEFYISSGTPDVIAVRFNNNYLTDQLFWIHSATPVNTWVKMWFRMSPAYKTVLGNSIASVQFGNEVGVGTVLIRNFKFTQDEGGSLNYNRSLNVIAGMPNMPLDSIFMRGVDDLPVHAQNATWMSNHTTRKFHADFGVMSTGYGIPINIDSNTAGATQKAVTAVYAAESDATVIPWRAGTYLAESWLSTASTATDHHVITVDSTTGIETDTYFYYDPNATTQNLNTYGATGLGLQSAHATVITDSIAVFDTKSTAMRQFDFTSSDATGLPVGQFVLRYADIENGDLAHPVRCTFHQCPGAIYPASHRAYSPTLSRSIYNDANAVSTVPLCAWLRMKAGYDISGYSTLVQRACRGFKKYGIINADNGGQFFVQGEPNDGWTQSLIDEFNNIPMSAFEFVDVSSKVIKPTSYRALP